MIDTGMFKFDLSKFDELMLEAMKEVDKNDYTIRDIVTGYLASLDNALVYNGFKRESVFPILRETSEKLHNLYITEVKGSDKSE